MRAWIKGAMFAACVSIGSTASAAPCAGFTDVDDASGFCPNVEWMKNRSITLGCTSATTYCPNEAVSRLAMAAFLNRLANALQPVFVHRTASGVAAAVEAGGVVCQSTPYAVTGYPRVATATAMFYHQADTAQDVSTRLVYSLNGGAGWQDFGAFLTTAANPAFRYASQSPVGKPLELDPGDVVMFGIDAGGNALDLVDAGCEMTVRLDSRTGTTTPFDRTVPASR